MLCLDWFKSLGYILLNSLDGGQFWNCFIVDLIFQNHQKLTQECGTEWMARKNKVIFLIGLYSEKGSIYFFNYWVYCWNRYRALKDGSFEGQYWPLQSNSCKNDADFSPFPVSTHFITWHRHGGSWHCTGGNDQDHLQEKECKKEKWLSEEAV